MVDNYMYYSDSRYVCNAPNCEVRSENTEDLLLFQTLIKGEVITLGFHSKCGLPESAQKCKMNSCNIYLNEFELHRINRYAIGYCSKHNHSIAHIIDTYNEMTIDAKILFENEYFYKLDDAINRKDQEESQYDYSYNDEQDEIYEASLYSYKEDERFDSYRGSQGVLLDHLSEADRNNKEKNERDMELLKSFQNAEDIRRGINRK